MIYKGKINYKLNKIILIITSSILLILLRELFVIYIAMIFYLDILLNEKLSNAILQGNEVLIKKYYLFGIIRKEMSYNLVNENRTLIKAFEDIPEDSETFSLKSLNKASNSNIIFYK